MSIERIGQFVGKTIGKKGFEYLKNKIENFEISSSGLENLEKVKDETYLLAANHLKPREKMAFNSGISPDAFILSKLIEENTGRKIKIVQKSDDGWWADNSVWHNFQKNIGQPFGRGFSKGVGNIPVQKNPGSFNRDFVESIHEVIEKKEPILIFPEGNWYEDFNKDNEISPGAAHIAKKYNLKIIPAYIKGATSWEDDQKVQVSFGEYFSPDELDKDQISEKIKEEISRLQQEVKNSEDIK